MRGLPQKQGAVGRWALAGGLLAGITLGVGAISLTPSLAWAEGPRVTAVQVDGAERVEPATVQSYLTVAVGDEATTEALDSSLKALYATGFFSDVTLRVEGTTLTVKVAENPIVNRIVFDGESAVSKEDLEKEVQLKPRMAYTLPRVQKDVQRILDVYRRSGRFGAIVEPRIAQRDHNRVDVTFAIREGNKTGVRKILFTGNTVYAAEELRSVIATREGAWWRFLSSSDYYDPDRLSLDRELLRRFYTNEGYADAQVLAAVAELTPDRRDFFVTFAVSEGPRYRVGAVKLDSAITGLDTEALRKDLLTPPGALYSAAQVEKSVQTLTTALGDRQYAFVDITPDLIRHPESKTVDLTYRIGQGPRVYIGRIDITGNERTLDKVIRREMLVAEGDPFNVSKIRRSEQRIKDLGFFEDVKITPVDAGHPDRADLHVVVREKATGEVSLGAGFSSTEGPLGSFTLRERNFLGKGQDARLSATLSGMTKQFDFGFTEPYFMDRDLSAGFDIFHSLSNYQSQSSYDDTATGFTLRAGYPLSENLRQIPRYTLRSEKISNVDVTASRFIREQQGTTLTSSIGQEISYDTRDSRLDPTKGFITRLNTDLAGLGGDRRYVRARLGGTQYVPLSEDYILSFLVEGGIIWGINQKIRIDERFMLGGDTLRGFSYAGIGPRDLTNSANDALGGNRFTRESLELMFPTPLPSDLGFRGALFMDAGTLGRVDSTALPGEAFRNDESLRVSTGVGLAWRSPFGPMRLDLGFPLMKKSYDKTELIHFSFGTRF